MAERRPEELSEKAESCWKDLWNEIHQTAVRAIKTEIYRPSPDVILCG